MRLTPAGLEAIRSSARQTFGAGCHVRLFGSRVDDTMRDGDIDLHVIAEPDVATLPNEIAFKLHLEERLGEQRVDVVLRPRSFIPRAIDDVAIETGVVLLRRATLLAEEEDLSSASRKDQRLRPEKLGALDPNLGLAAVAELRNRLSHSYPDDPGRQAAITNLVAEKAVDLLAGFDSLLAYAAKFEAGSGLGAVDITVPKRGLPS